MILTAILAILNTIMFVILIAHIMAITNAAGSSYKFISFVFLFAVSPIKTFKKLKRYNEFSAHRQELKRSDTFMLAKLQAQKHRIKEATVRQSYRTAQQEHRKLQQMGML